MLVSPLYLSLPPSSFSCLLLSSPGFRSSLLRFFQILRYHLRFYSRWFNSTNHSTITRHGNFVFFAPGAQAGHRPQARRFDPGNHGDHWAAPGPGCLVWRPWPWWPHCNKFGLLGKLWPNDGRNVWKIYGHVSDMWSVSECFGSFFQQICKKVSKGWS